VKIQKIKLNNFKSIYGDFEMDFEKDIKGMWKIVGPVGVGKTTIGESIIFGLFGNVKNKNNDSLISWGEKHTTVELWCESKGKHIYINREINSYGQSPISVKIDGEDLIYTDKRDIQSQLENEYYDISRTTVELLCVISFNNFKSLASLNTQDSRKFLDNVLGFAALTKYVDAGKVLRSENTVNINRLQSLIDQCNAQIRKINELTNIEVIDGNIDVVKKDIDTYNKKVQEQKDIYEKTVRDARKVIEESSAELASVKALGVNKAKEIAFIQKGTCPTCGAPIDQSMLPVKEKERDVLRKQYVTINERLEKEKLVPGQIRDKYEKEVGPIREELERNKALLVRLQEQAKRAKVNNGEIDKIEQQLREYEMNLGDAQFEDQQWELLLDLLGNDIRANILSSFIPVLNENIMKYSQRLRQRYIIQFDNQFKCQIRLPGTDEDIPVSSLSTGQLKTVDMIIIMSVLGTVMGSNSLNIVFLDELFSNMHSELRNEMSWMLRDDMQPDETIFVVSHYEINEGFFDGTIKVSLEPKGQYWEQSKIEIIHNV
jgi:DNA repair exonuclease SbcCD ATPase subunit